MVPEVKTLTKANIKLLVTPAYLRLQAVKRVILCCYLCSINLFLQIIETENMMDRIVTGLSESSVKVRLAAVRYEL